MHFYNMFTKACIAHSHTHTLTHTHAHAHVQMHTCPSYGTNRMASTNIAICVCLCDISVYISTHMTQFGNTTQHTHNPHITHTQMHTHAYTHTQPIHPMTPSDTQASDCITHTHIHKARRMTHWQTRNHLSPIHKALASLHAACL